MGGCQNCGPFWGTLNDRCRIIIGTQKGTIILTTTYMVLMKFLGGLLGSVLGYEGSATVLCGFLDGGVFLLRGFLLTRQGRCPGHFRPKTQTSYTSLLTQPFLIPCRIYCISKCKRTGY